MPKATSLINKNVLTRRGRTSMRFELAYWEALDEICVSYNCSMPDLIRRIEDQTPPNNGSRTSAVRVFVLQFYRDKVTAESLTNAEYFLMSTLADAYRSLRETYAHDMGHEAPAMNELQMCVQRILTARTQSKPPSKRKYKRKGKP